MTSGSLYFEQPREDYVAYRHLADDEIDAFIRAQEWRTAKSYPDAPHSYVSRSKCTDVQTFEALIAHIRKRGYRQKWGKYTYTYLDWVVDGVTFQLWTLGWPVAQTQVINRCIKATTVS